MKTGPFVSPCGISLFDALQHREYQSTLSTLQEAHNQAKLAAHRLKQQDTMVKETSQENIPSDLLDVIAGLTTVSQLLYTIICLYLTFCVMITAGWGSPCNNFTSKAACD